VESGLTEAQTDLLIDVLLDSADTSVFLAAALESRTAIDIASGVIMAQTGCSQKEAVNVLMNASSNRNEKLPDAALSVARFNGAAPLPTSTQLHESSRRKEPRVKLLESATAPALWGMTEVRKLWMTPSR
jgi:hypothetical protein